MRKLPLCSLLTLFYRYIKVAPLWQSAITHILLRDIRYPSCVYNSDSLNNMSSWSDDKDSGGTVSRAASLLSLNELALLYRAAHYRRPAILTKRCWGKYFIP